MATKDKQVTNYFLKMLLMPKTTKGTCHTVEHSIELSLRNKTK